MRVCVGPSVWVKCSIAAYGIFVVIVQAIDNNSFNVSAGKMNEIHIHMYHSHRSLPKSKFRSIYSLLKSSKNLKYEIEESSLDSGIFFAINPLLSKFILQRTLSHWQRKGFFTHWRLGANNNQITFYWLQKCSI